MNQCPACAAPVQVSPATAWHLAHLDAAANAADLAAAVAAAA